MRSYIVSDEQSRKELLGKNNWTHDKQFSWNDMVFLACLAMYPLDTLQDTSLTLSDEFAHFIFLQIIIKSILSLTVFYSWILLANAQSTHTSRQIYNYLTPPSKWIMLESDFSVSIVCHFNEAAQSILNEQTASEPASTNKTHRPISGNSGVTVRPSGRNSFCAAVPADKTAEAALFTHCWGIKKGLQYHRVDEQGGLTVQLCWLTLTRRFYVGSQTDCKTWGRGVHWQAWLSRGRMETPICLLSRQMTAWRPTALQACSAQTLFTHCWNPAGGGHFIFQFKDSGTDKALKCFLFFSHYKIYSLGAFKWVFQWLVVVLSESRKSSRGHI